MNEEKLRTSNLLDMADHSESDKKILRRWDVVELGEEMKILS